MVPSFASFWAIFWCFKSLQKWDVFRIFWCFLGQTWMDLIFMSPSQLRCSSQGTSLAGSSRPSAMAMSRKHGKNDVKLETTKIGGGTSFSGKPACGNCMKLLLNTPNFYKHIQKSDINGSQWEMVCNWIYNILKRTSEKMASVHVHIITFVCLIKPSDFGRRFSEACPHSSHIHLV